MGEQGEKCKWERRKEYDLGVDDQKSGDYIGC
jgi:hypothetical protein